MHVFTILKETNWEKTISLLLVGSLVLCFSSVLKAQFYVEESKLFSPSASPILQEVYKDHRGQSMLAKTTSMKIDPFMGRSTFIL